MQFAGDSPNAHRSGSVEDHQLDDRFPAVATDWKWPAV
jgi:hypothetical protein